MFKCPVCIETMWCPFALTKCGHTFCFDCVIRVLDASQFASAKCPYGCGESYDCHSIMPIYAIRMELAPDDGDRMQLCMSILTERRAAATATASGTASGPITAPAPSSTAAAPSSAAASTSASASTDEEDGEYMVETILDHAYDNDYSFYLVQWFGYDQ